MFGSFVVQKRFGQAFNGWWCRLPTRVYALVGVYLCRFASTCSLLAVVMESECGILVFVSGNHGMEVMCIGADLGMRGGSPLY